jgi:hypothetical protein
VALRLYEDLAGLRGCVEWLGLLVFFWGGGLLALAGAGLDLVRNGRVSSASLFQLDPFDGWWFLFEEVRALFHDGAFRPEWFDRWILVVMTRPRGQGDDSPDPPCVAQYGLEPVFQNRSYRILRRRPGKPASRVANAKSPYREGFNSELKAAFSVAVIFPTRQFSNWTD